MLLFDPLNIFLIQTRKTIIMAGGKETPRQKMIGMMYLVLTALLALNVSKSILDAFVAIEENIQKANITEVFRGDDKRSELVKIASDGSNKIRAAKAKKYLEVVAEIDAMTAKRIKLIDDIKLEILRECGEDIESKGDMAIIQTPYDPKNTPCTPIRMDLDKVNGKDKYDDPMRVILGSNTDIKKPEGRGMDIWKSLISYRKELTEKIASSRVIAGKDGKLGFDTQYHFKAPAINDFSGPQELNNEIGKAIKKSNVHLDDKDVLMEIYRSLSKEEYSTVHDIKGVHWLGKTFDHSPSVAAIASLSSLQRDILSARAQAIAHIRTRVGGGDYTFNEIISLAHGPEVVNQGEDFTVSVLMAAYDSDKQPRVTIDGKNVTDVRNGMGNISLKGTGGTMELKGTIAVQNRQGIWKERPWSKKVTVMTPSGSIELPEFNVLYREYKNQVNATASGYPNTQLTGTNVTIQKSGSGYIVKPGNGRTATLSVSGQTADGRTIQLKRMQFSVRRLPSADLYWGGQKQGGSINGSNLLTAKLDPGVPLNTKYTVISWRATTTGMRAPDVTGQGGNISSLRQLVNLIQPGQSVVITAKVRRPDNIIETRDGVWTK